MPPTRKTAIPFTFVPATFAKKWGITAEHYVNYDAKTPNVASFVIFQCITNKSVDYFRGHKLSTADWRLKIGFGIDGW